MNRLNNLFLLSLCFVRAVFCGVSRKKQVSHKKVVIIQRAAIGDMVCTTPLFSGLKRVFPKCEITILGNKINKELLDRNHDVSRYVIWKSFWDSVSELKSGDFNVGILVAPSPDSLSALLLSGIPFVIAPRMSKKTPFQTISYRLLLSLCEVAGHSIGSYAPREYLRLLEPLGIFANNTEKKLAYSDVANEKVDKFFAEHAKFKNILRIGIAHSTGAKFKEWPAERFGKLTVKLWEKYRACIFIVGASYDENEAIKMKSAIPENIPFIDTVGKWNIDELKAFISKLDLFIGADTGPIYIAEAFNVPTVDIIGPVDEKDQPPRGLLHKVVFDESRKSPVTGVFTNKFYNYEEARRQAEAITVEQVFSVVEECIYEKNLNTRK